MRIRVQILPIIALIALALPRGASAFTLDNFTTALPPNPCLPATSQPVVFAGPFCDGASCPPGSWVTCGSREAAQLGSPGVLAGTRRQVTAYEWDESGTVSARIQPAAQRLDASLDLTGEGVVGLDYGTPGDYRQDPEALNLDLVAMQVIGVQFTLAGNFTPDQPLLIGIELLSDTPGDPPRPSAFAYRVITAPGTVMIALDDFTQTLPELTFSMSDVDDIQIWFSNCTDADNGCPGATYHPVQFSVGSIEFVQGPTPSSRTSWGRIKALYR